MSGRYVVVNYPPSLGPIEYSAARKSAQLAILPGDAFFFLPVGWTVTATESTAAEIAAAARNLLSRLPRCHKCGEVATQQRVYQPGSAKSTLQQTEQDSVGEVWEPK